jgi:membrane protein implicated in regulation of membrane protease activity
VSLDAAWLWIIAGVALGAAEMLVPSFYLIWPGLAALAVGLTLLAVPSLGLAGQVTLFALLAVGLTLAGRRYLLDHLPQSGHRPALNQRGRRMIGRRGMARGRFTGGRGTVEIDGELWQARARGAVVSDSDVEVVDAEGMTLTVEAR